MAGNHNSISNFLVNPAGFMKLIPSQDNKLEEQKVPNANIYCCTPPILFNFSRGKQERIKKSLT